MSYGLELGGKSGDRFGEELRGCNTNFLHSLTLVSMSYDVISESLLETVISSHIESESVVIELYVEFTDDTCHMLMTAVGVGNTDLYRTRYHGPTHLPTNLMMYVWAYCCMTSSAGS